MRDTWTILPRRVRWPLMSALAVVLAFGTLYTGYCYSWWGRNNLLLQYLFQCHCPAASEPARYRPFRVIVSACENPRLLDNSPSGQFVLIGINDTNAGGDQIVRLDLHTGERLPLNMRGRGVQFVTDQTILTTNRGYDRSYGLFDLRDQTYVDIKSVAYMYNQPLSSATLDTLRMADRVILLNDKIVAITDDYKRNPQKSLIIYDTGEQSRKHMNEVLNNANINHQGALVTPTGPFLDTIYTQDKQLLATPNGVYQGSTQDPLVQIDQPTLHPSFQPSGWVLNNRAVVYTRSPVYAIDLGPEYILPSRFFPVPQPLLLLEVPQAGE